MLSFTAKDARFLRGIEFDRDEPYLLENYAFPLDKNNLIRFKITVNFTNQNTQSYKL